MRGNFSKVVFQTEEVFEQKINIPKYLNQRYEGENLIVDNLLKELIFNYQVWQPNNKHKRFGIVRFLAKQKVIMLLKVLDLKP